MSNPSIFSPSINRIILVSFGCNWGCILLGHIHASYNTARFKLYAREYILANINTFSLSSQPMLASKGSMLVSKGYMLSSKGNMLSCMILLQLQLKLACNYLHASGIVQSVDAPEQDYMLSCIILFAI